MKEVLLANLLGVDNDQRYEQGRAASAAQNTAAVFAETLQTAMAADGIAGSAGVYLPIDVVVYSLGDERPDLIDNISNASTIDERLAWADQLRDAVIDKLRASGHTAEQIGKPDKIVIDGRLYDILNSVNGLGMRTALQLLDLGPWGQGGANPAPVPGGDARAAILAAGARHLDSYARISSLADVEQRRALAVELRQKVMEALQNAGFNVQAHDDPDKMIVGGRTYDFIQSLNAAGAQANLQALLLA